MVFYRILLGGFAQYLFFEHGFMGEIYVQILGKIGQTHRFDSIDNDLQGKFCFCDICIQSITLHAY